MDKMVLKQTISQLNQIADVLYKGNTRAGIAAMGMVIPNLTLVSTLIDDEEMKARLVNDALTPALQAMEEQDGVLLADIITYELLGILTIYEDGE